MIFSEGCPDKGDGALCEEPQRVKIQPRETYAEEGLVQVGLKSNANLPFILQILCVIVTILV